MLPMVTTRILFYDAIFMNFFMKPIHNNKMVIFYTRLHFII